MAVIENRDMFVERIRARLGEDTSDEAISFLEDMSDTYDHLNSMAGDGEGWRSRYEENDRAWRERYTQRFSGIVTPETETLKAEHDTPAGNSESDPVENIHIDDILYKEG